MTGAPIDTAPEALFATFLDGVREIYARDGMRGVMAVALAAADGAPPKRAAFGAAPWSMRDGPAIADLGDDEMFEALVAALESAFLHGGLEAAIGELSLVGTVIARVVHAPSRARAKRQTRPPGARRSAAPRREEREGRP